MEQRKGDSTVCQTVQYVWLRCVAKPAHLLVNAVQLRSINVKPGGKHVREQPTYQSLQQA